MKTRVMTKILLRPLRLTNKQVNSSFRGTQCHFWFNLILVFLFSIRTLRCGLDGQPENIMTLATTYVIIIKGICHINFNYKKRLSWFRRASPFVCQSCKTSLLIEWEWLQRASRGHNNMHVQWVMKLMVIKFAIHRLGEWILQMASSINMRVL